jgi:polar amino acid transport system substrate-binding protein
LIRTTALLAVLALILTACSTAGSSSSPSAAASTAASQPASEPAGSASTEPSATASEGQSTAPSTGTGSGTSFDPSTVTPDSLLGQIMEAGVVRISTDPNYAPYSFLDTATGEYVGFDNGTAEEVVKRMSEKLGKQIEIQWETPGWDLITAGSWGGRWDMSIGSMSITEARARVVDFADPYYFDGGGVAVPADSAVTSVEELSGGKTFCVGTATVYEQWLQGTLEIPAENIKTEPPTDPQITALPTDNECIQAVAAGRTFDGIVANINALEEAQKAGQPIKVITPEPVLLVEVAFALDKGGPDTASMLELLNIIVGEMHEDGTLTELSMEHLDKDVTKQPE